MWGVVNTVMVVRCGMEKPGILVVDDVPEICALLKIFLEEKGFAVWEAHGRQAIELFQSHAAAIDVVLLDVQMPDMDGPAVLDALRKIKPAVRCCFMRCSFGAYSRKELVARGAALVLDKPFELEDLLKTLHELMG